MKGKNKCRILKEIRQKIADENDIPYVTRECTYQGDCKGTCPKCEAELRYLEQELEKRRSLGKAVAVAAVAAGLSLSLTACTPKEGTASPQPPAAQTEHTERTDPPELEGEPTEIVDGEIDTLPLEGEPTEVLVGEIDTLPPDESSGETDTAYELEGDVAYIPADTETAGGVPVSGDMVP